MPKDEFIWRGEEVIVEKSSCVNTLLDRFNDVFQNGFNQTDLDKKLLEKFKPLPQTYISASSIKCRDNEFIGRDNELVSAGTYGFIYLIKADNLSIVSLPKEKGSYAIVSKIDPKLIVGAMPSTFVAFALGIPEQSFITNPAYNKTFDCEKIKAAIGVEYVLIVSKRFHDLNDSLSEVYQRYLQAEESSSQPVALVQNHPSVTFFQSSADNSFSKETQKSPHP
ncbi:MAG: hypothetical protein WAL30_01900 [Candidatus Aquirickettsiella sp.]